MIKVCLGFSSTLAASIINDNFVYDGANNPFELTYTAKKVLMVFIDNGAFPEEVPIGSVTEVNIDGGLLLPGNKVTIQYIKS